MRYKTKVMVITGGKTYKPGEILPQNISAEDLLFLKSKNFIEPVDIADVVKDIEVDSEESIDFEGFHEVEPQILKNSDEIRKIRAKKDIYAYADSIGLDLGENYEEKNLKELQEIVINFQEEKMVEDEEKESESWCSYDV